MFIEYQEGRETILLLYKFSLFNINRSYTARYCGIAATFLFGSQLNDATERLIRCEGIDSHFHQIIS